MLTILLSTTISFLVSKYYFSAETENVVLFGFMGTGVGLAISLAIAGVVKSIEEKVETWELASIRSTVHSNGDFFLGCGTFESHPYYFYYLRQNDSGFKLKKKRADMDNAIVYEEDRKDAILELCSRRPKSFLWTIPVETENIYKFRIPAGSIKRDFTL